MTLALVAKRLAGSEPAFEAVPLIAEKVDDYHMVPGTGIEPVRLAARDFKSLVSTNFTIRAVGFIVGSGSGCEAILPCRQRRLFANPEGMIAIRCAR